MFLHGSICCLALFLQSAPLVTFVQLLSKKLIDVFEKLVKGAVESLQAAIKCVSSQNLLLGIRQEYVASRCN